MRWLIGFLGVLVLLALFIWFAGVGRETWTSRFRIGVEVETPHGLKTGSSVIEMRTERASGFLIWHEARGARSNIRGEAVFVDLGPDKNGKPQNLIALLATGKRGEDPNFGLLIARVFLGANRHQGTMGFGSFAAALENLPTGKRVVLAPPNMPTLVSFRDLSNPSSARVVPSDPRTISETDFGAVFGNGYQLKHISLERVNAPVSLGSIAKKLTWLGRPLPWHTRSSSGGYVDTRPYDATSYRLQAHHFRRK